jgi:hypothetical protein
MHPREFGTWKVVLISIEFRSQLISQNQKKFVTPHNQVQGKPMPSLMYVIVLTQFLE